MTNLEKIKQMTDEELADGFYKMICYTCAFCPVTNCKFGKTCEENIKEWLESEVETK